LFAVRSALRKHGRVIVGVGSTQHSHRWDNPFTVGERFDMWTAALAEARWNDVHLHPLPDLHRPDDWVDHVKDLLPAFDVVVTNNALTRRLFEEAGHRVEEGPLWRPETCSGTRIRQLWAEGKDPGSLLAPGVARVATSIEAPARLRSLMPR
jgi:nicotinamide-nucleotide adenylyltransferase